MSATSVPRLHERQSISIITFKLAPGCLHCRLKHTDCQSGLCSADCTQHVSSSLAHVCVLRQITRGCRQLPRTPAARCRRLMLHSGCVTQTSGTSAAAWQLLRQPQGELRTGRRTWRGGWLQLRVKLPSEHPNCTCLRFASDLPERMTRQML